MMRSAFLSTSSWLALAIASAPSIRIFSSAMFMAGKQLGVLAEKPTSGTRG